MLQLRLTSVRVSFKIYQAQNLNYVILDQFEIAQYFMSFKSD